MRLILAHRHDMAARELAARWGDDVILLTPADLHTERLLLTVSQRGRARAELRSRPPVTAVLSRLGGVGPVDLDHVAPQDLAYAATELDAFLRAWLLAWPGPVVNRPTATCLNGPGWRPEQWSLAAAAVGLTIRPVQRLVATAPTSRSQLTPDRAVAACARSNGDPVRVTVVGNRWFGPVPGDLGRRLCALARMADCTLIEAIVDSGGTVLHASAWPDVSAPDVADALVPFLGGAS
jgi:hypothetical protein